MSTPSSFLYNAPSSAFHHVSRSLRRNPRCRGAPSYHIAGPIRYLATVRQDPKVQPDLFLTLSRAYRTQEPGTHGHQPDQRRRVNLGKTLRILQQRLPTLLQKPLPQEILSPQITLHLFPSTHPHLPTVSGRVAYSAALWTSPIAWGRLPLISNVKLEILSERMIRDCHSQETLERLVVRWRTIGKTRGMGADAFYRGIGTGENVEKITGWLGRSKGEDHSKEFMGLFIFEFDIEGRVRTHTIEHAQEGGNWEKGVGAKVVGLTDWLLGGMKGNSDKQGASCPVFWGSDSPHSQNRSSR